MDETVVAPDSSVIHERLEEADPEELFEIPARDLLGEGDEVFCGGVTVGERGGIGP
jgi:hypothetical protein